MLSFEKLKDFLILIFTFGIIYWFQQVDDKKRCKKRDNIYDTIKLPLLVTSIVGLVLFWEKQNIFSLFVSVEPLRNSLTNSLPNPLPNSLQNPLPNSLSNPLTNSLPNPLSNSLPNSLPNPLPNANSQLGGGDFIQNDELNVFTELPEW